MSRLVHKRGLVSILHQGDETRRAERVRTRVLRNVCAAIALFALPVIDDLNRVIIKDNKATTIALADVSVALDAVFVKHTRCGLVTVECVRKLTVEVSTVRCTFDARELEAVHSRECGVSKNPKRERRVFFGELEQVNVCVNCIKFLDSARH